MPPRERGYALLFVLLLLALLETAAMLIATGLSIRQRALRDEERRLDVAALADSGLASALAHLEIDPDFPGEGPIALARGSYETTVEPIGSLRVLAQVSVLRHGYRRRYLAEIDLSGSRPKVDSWDSETRAASP